jgi:C4-dicarboxylate transporter, DctM subunit
VLNVFLLVVGMVMDGFSAILVTVPLVVPLAARFGFDPFHLAVMFLLNLELAFLMPPLGLNLFISAFRFQRPLGEVYRATLPFVGVVGATLLLVIGVPWLSNVAVQPAIVKARAEAERLGVPPTQAWSLECVQEDTTHPKPCTEVEKKKYEAPPDEGEDDELMKQMMQGG